MPFLHYDAESTYYFFSTGTQSVAALAGLNSAMAIFRYQAILSQIDLVQTGLLTRFKPVVYPYLVKLGRDPEYDALSHDERRMDYLYDRLVEFGETPGFKAYLAADYFGIAESDYESHSKRYIDPLRAEVGHHEEHVRKATAFRKGILVVSGFGMLLVVFGLCGTLLPAMEGISAAAHVQLKMLFVMWLVGYAVLVFRLTQMSFLKLEF